MGQTVRYTGVWRSCAHRGAGSRALGEPGSVAQAGPNRPRQAVPWTSQPLGGHTTRRRHRVPMPPRTDGLVLLRRFAMPPAWRLEGLFVARTARRRQRKAVAWQIRRGPRCSPVTPWQSPGGRGAGRSPEAGPARTAGAPPRTTGLTSSSVSGVALPGPGGHDAKLRLSAVTVWGNCRTTCRRTGQSGRAGGQA